VVSADGYDSDGRACGLCAIKIMALGSDPDTKWLIINEREAYLRIHGTRSEYVCKAYDIWDDETHRYFVMVCLVTPSELQRLRTCPTSHCSTKVSASG
jgi:hypothetical protein